MATDTFSCPHCATSYPLVAAMRGRKIRCRTCQSALLIDQLGEVSLLDDERSALLVTDHCEGDAGVATADPSATRRPRDPGLRSEPTAHDAAAQPSVSERRAQLKSRLAQSADQVMEAVAVLDHVREAPGAAADFVPLRRGSSAGHRWRRVLLVGMTAALIVVGLVALVPSDSPERQALQRLAVAVRAVDGGAARGDQTQAVWGRHCWSQQRHLPVIVNLDQGEIVDRERIDGAALQTVAGVLGGLRRVVGYDLWVDESRLAALRAALPDSEAAVVAATGGDPSAEPELEALVAALSASGIQVQTNAALLGRLSAIDDLPSLVIDMARQQVLDGDDQAPWFRLPAPSAMSLFNVRGDDGAVLRKQGAAWFFDHQPYDVGLLAAEGSQWPAGYRLVSARIQP